MDKLDHDAGRMDSQGMQATVQIFVIIPAGDDVGAVAAPGDLLAPVRFQLLVGELVAVAAKQQDVDGLMRHVLGHGNFLSAEEWDKELPPAYGEEAPRDKFASLGLRPELEQKYGWKNDPRQGTVDREMTRKRASPCLGCARPVEEWELLLPH